ncbi:MAG TPA: nuclease-related domain-containing protein [Solirubrobacteraceae bacterium]|nr:nuclease-related domain-containing protein [Solirubrobacteraceae bacterium]
MPKPDDDEPLDRGVAGASARREHERRQANRERQTRERHPRIGNMLLAFRDPPSHEQAWATGATGEERVAAFLDKRLGDDAIVLHDRRIPRSRANVDHIAITRAAVWVVDAKRYKGKVAIRRPLFGAAKLTIAGRDRTALVDAVAKQVTLVAAVLADIAPGAEVRGALCFVDAELPVLGRLLFDGYPLVHPRGLARLMKAGAPIRTTDEMLRVARQLAKRFPVA